MCPLTENIHVEHGEQSIPHPSGSIGAVLRGAVKNRSSRVGRLPTHVDHVEHLMKRIERHNLLEEVECCISFVCVGK